MKKYMWGFAILLLISVFVTCENEKHAQNTNTESQPRSSPTVTSANPIKTKGNNENAKRNFPSWPAIVVYRIFSFPNGITVWALFLTLAVISEQTQETRKAAEAANRSIGLQEADLRPWLLIEIRKSHRLCLLDNGTVRFTWIVKNVGKSPARILEVGARICLDTLGPEMKDIPDYGRPKSMDRQILVPGGTVAFQVFWSKIEGGKERLDTGKTAAAFDDLAVIFGYVDYRPAFDSDKPFVSRFCLAASIDKGYVKDRFESWEFCGPKYTEST